MHSPTPAYGLHAVLIFVVGSELPNLPVDLAGFRLVLFALIYFLALCLVITAVNFLIGQPVQRGINGFPRLWACIGAHIAAPGSQGQHIDRLTALPRNGISRHCFDPFLPRVVMKIRNSLKSAKTRDKNCRVVRRHGRVYVINKKNPRMKARQG